VLIWGGIARGLVLSAIPISWVFGWLTIELLFLVAFVTGTLFVFTSIASGAYLPSLVPKHQLLAANSKLAFINTSTETIGQVVAGLIVQLLRAPFAIVIEVVASFCGAFMVSTTREIANVALEAERPREFWSELKEGIIYTFGHELFRTILATNVMWNIAMAGQFAIAVPFLIGTLGANAFTVGLVFAIGGAGGLVGAFVVAPLSRRLSSGAVWRWALVVGPILGLLVPLSALVPGQLGALGFGLGSAFLAATIAITSVITGAARQTLCPPTMLGRLGAVSQFVSWGVIPIGAIVFGALAAVFNLTTAMWLVAALFFACPVIARLSPLWRIPNLETAFD
jgi:MFS family permease